MVETFAPEGPKIVRHRDYFYLVTAVGGTAGPPTGHMVIMARSLSIDGPWQNDPGNPVIRTASERGKWWSRGHATLFEGPGGGWWMIYHGYENGYWTLGRQTLLEPVTWSDDGWVSPRGGDLSRPLRKPRDLGAQPHGLASATSRGRPLRHPMGLLRSWRRRDGARPLADRTLHLRARALIRAIHRRSAASAATRATGSRPRSRPIRAPKRACSCSTTGASMRASA